MPWRGSRGRSSRRWSTAGALQLALALDLADGREHISGLNIGNGHATQRHLQKRNQVLAAGSGAGGPSFLAVALPLIAILFGNRCKRVSRLDLGTKLFSLPLARRVLARRKKLSGLVTASAGFGQANDGIGSNRELLLAAIETVLETLKLPI